ncbi:MAG: helix-turn-helix transcriptional regulator [Bdellovibrionaceae bacterium]|nr:helix-turn-helix transcriptional regulator [Bdellovibrionales bacterium]MCB9082754.1 helix-turn-helix transcriptional regulator [Pseudobdellovibrionaceae bacterium]
MEKESHDEFRQLLQEELDRRISKNPRYSLRAFAAALQVDSSLLSKILNNKRAISLSMAEHLIGRLNLPPGKAAQLTASHRPEQPVIQHFESGIYFGEGLCTKSESGPFPYDLWLTIEESGRITRLQKLKDGTVISDSEWQIVYPTHGSSFHFVDKDGVVIGNGMVGDDHYIRYSFHYSDPAFEGLTFFIEEDIIREGESLHRKGRMFKPGSGRETLQEWRETLSRV